jgi:hypothetical protein
MRFSRRCSFGVNKHGCIAKRASSWRRTERHVAIDRKSEVATLDHRTAERFAAPSDRAAMSAGTFSFLGGSQVE